MCAKAPLSSEQLQGDLFDTDTQPETSLPLNKPKLIKVKRTRTPVIASRYLSIEEVAKRYSVGHSTIWRWVKKGGQFPAPIKLSPGTSRWLEAELLEFESGASLSSSANPTKSREVSRTFKSKGSAS